MECWHNLYCKAHKTYIWTNCEIIETEWKKLAWCCDMTHQTFRWFGYGIGISGKKVTPYVLFEITFKLSNHRFRLRIFLATLSKTVHHFPAFCSIFSSQFIFQIQSSRISPHCGGTTTYSRILVASSKKPHVFINSHAT